MSWIEDLDLKPDTRKTFEEVAEELKFWAVPEESIPELITKIYVATKNEYGD